MPYADSPKWLARERQDVSRALLPAGTVVELDLVLLVADGEGFRVRRKAQVTMDGEGVGTVRLAHPEDPYSLTAASPPTEEVNLLLGPVSFCL